MPSIAYKIIDVRPMPSADPARRGMTDMIISWQEDGFRPYQLTMHREDYTPEMGIAAVEAEVRKHASIINAEGTIEV